MNTGTFVGTGVGQEDDHSDSVITADSVGNGVGQEDGHSEGHCEGHSDGESESIIDGTLDGSELDVGSCLLGACDGNPGWGW